MVAEYNTVSEAIFNVLTGLGSSSAGGIWERDGEDYLHFQGKYREYQSLTNLNAFINEIKVTGQDSSKQLKIVGTVKFNNYTWTQTSGYKSVYFRIYGPSGGDEIIWYHQIGNDFSQDTYGESYRDIFFTEWNEPTPLNTDSVWGLSPFYDNAKDCPTSGYFKASWHARLLAGYIELQDADR